MDINDLVKLLPPDYEEACYETKAMIRKRTIKTPFDLLTLILYYLSGNHSLIDVSQFALMNHIGKISDVAFRKRMIQSKEWLQWLTKNILPKCILSYKKPDWLTDYQMIAVDASDLVEKGTNQREWHLHYAVDIFSLTCHQFQLTQQSTGESLTNFTLKEGELILGDRAYGTCVGIEHCMENGCDFILRMKHKAFNLYNKNGERLFLTNWLKTVEETAKELPVWIRRSDKTSIPLRICAVKRTKE